MPPVSTTPHHPSYASQLREGRDHLNLAEWPISILQRQQPTDREGRKADTIVYQASRYDAVTGRRIPQTVTLTTNSRSGLPTPADENLLLALLFVAKRSGELTEQKVHFTPRQLFSVMGWSPNSRSYQRLREVLRRLKALTIQFENAWWDNEGRQFEEEFATGIIAAYHIVRQTAGRKRPHSDPGSWVLWNPDFHASLQAGSLKRLDLERLFSLRLPTTQRMYRFLDKHFYHRSQLEFDLREFACGHIGLSQSYVTPKLKSKLAPAIRELEEIGYIAPAEKAERYQRIKPGVWRIRFAKADASRRLPEENPRERKQSSLVAELASRGVSEKTAHQLGEKFPERSIREKLEVFDWLQRSEDRSLLKNPAGWLVMSIRNDYAAPAGFKPKGEREAQKREREQRLQSINQKTNPHKTAQQQQQKAVDDWLETLTKEEQHALERDAMEHGEPILLRQYRRSENEATRRSLKQTVVRRYAAQKMPKQDS